MPLFKTDLKPNASPRINVIAILIFLVHFLPGLGLSLSSQSPIWAVAGFLLGFILGKSPQISNQWERAIVLRLGKFRGRRGRHAPVSAFREKGVAAAFGHA